MSIAPSRRLRLMIPHADGTAMLASDGDLPSVELAVLDGEPTSAAAARWLDHAGLHPWLVESIVDQSEDDELGGSTREALIETAPPPDGWTPPDGWVWCAWDAVRPSVARGIAEVSEMRLAEWRGERSIPVERSAWSRPGWFERVRAWIDESFVEAGMPVPDRVVQIRHWGTSAVMRVDVGAERFWFKSTIPLFHAEAGVTAALAQLSDGATPDVIAVDPERNWMILEDLGATSADAPEEGVGAIDALVCLQRSMAGRIDELVAAGCPDRPLSGLPGELAHALASPIVIDRFGVDDTTRSLAASRLAAALPTVEALDFPITLIHGDLHPGNVAATPRGPVFFDWSDACTGSPVVEIGPWASWFEDDPAADEELWGWYQAAWHREFGVDTSDLDREIVDIVAGAYHFVSFLRIIETLEPFRHDELADGLDYFFGRLVGGAGTG